MIKSRHMRTLLKPFALTAALAVLASALPAAAASGDLAAIAVRDFDRDGKIDRLVVSVANPDHAAWSVTDASGFAVTYGGQPLALKGVAVTAAASDPATLEVLLDTSDTGLPRDTSADKFELSFSGSGVTAGAMALAAFASGDAGNATAERDEAAPILLGSTPAAGSIDVLRSADLSLSFSEAVSLPSLVPSSARNPGQWGFTASADGKTVTVTHLAYQANVDESFGIAGTDLAGNALVVGAYPNPFTFRTTDDTTPSTRVDNVFLLTAPVAFGTLPASGGAHLAWYTNLADVASVRLSYSTDAGATYAAIATAPVAQGTVVWYPPNVTSAFQLRLEGLNAGGTPIASAFVSPVSLSGAWAPAPPAPTVVSAGTPVDNGTAPSLVGNAVVDMFDAGARTARLSWTTDEPTRAEVRYGPELDYRGQADLTAFTTAHEVTLRDLTPGALHQARITSLDAQGNATVSKDWYFVFLREGDLIKGSGPAVYRYEAGKRRAFPHLEVYRSWYGDDFSKVIRVPDTQLGTIALGKNMTMKEGVFLVKIQSDPKTYAVEPGAVLRWIQTEADARALYGAAWAKRARDVDVSLFSDYAIGAPLAGGEKPAGYAG